MAISFVGSGSDGAANAGDPSIDLTGLSLQQNDLVIVAFTEAGATGDADLDLTMTTADYTQVADLFSDDTIQTNFAVFYKFMGATPDTTAVANGSGDAQNGAVAALQVFRGVDTTTPMDVAATTNTGTGGFSPDPPSIDWSTAGVWVVIAGGSGTTVGAGGVYTNPTGYTTNAVSLAQNDTNDATAGMGYNSSPSDPEDPGVMTHSGTDSANFSWAAVTMALRPAAGAATVVQDIIGPGIIPFAR